MKTKSFLLVIMLLSVLVTNTTYAVGTQPGPPDSIEAAWLEGRLGVADPAGVITFGTHFGSLNTQTLTDPAFTKVSGSTSTNSYILPISGQSGLYAKSDSFALRPGTYTEAVSRYYDTFRFEDSVFHPMHITLSMGVTYRFISPPIDYQNSKAGGVSMALYIYNPITDTTRIISNNATQNHTTGGWDTPGPGSMGIINDLGQYMQWYGGRTTDTFEYGDEVTLMFEYKVWAMNGAIVDAISTGDFKFLLSDDDKIDDSLIVTSETNGFYQVDGVLPPTITPEPTTMLLLGLGLVGLVGIRKKMQ